MSLDETTINDLGRRLYDAWDNATQITPITESAPDITIEEAYQVQLSMINRRLLQGESIVGKKIGITAKAVMNMLGVNKPDFGHLMSGMEFKESQSLPFEIFCQPKGEGEIAFLLKKDLTGPGITTAQVIAATDCVLPAYEIVDSRIENWNIKIQDTVADNASAAAFVLGSGLRAVIRRELFGAGC